MEDVKPGTELPWSVEHKVGERMAIRSAAQGIRVAEITGSLGTEDSWAKNVAEDAAYIEHACNRLPELEVENLEQARLLGLSGSKEAALLAKLDAAEKELTRLRAQVEEIRKGFALSCLVLAAKDQEIMDDFERRGLKEVILEASEPLDNNKLVSITIAEAWQKLSLLPSPPLEKEPDHAQD